VPFALSISSARRLRQKGRDERAVLDALLDNVDVAVVACDTDGRVTHANRRTRELMADEGPLGMEPEGWIEHLRPRTVDGVPLSLDELPILRALRGEDVRGLDLRVNAQNSELILSLSANPIVDERGRTLGAVVVFEDVTKQRLREAQMRSELNELALAVEVEDALSSDQLTLFSQPVVDSRSGDTVFEELLLRIRSSDGTYKGPSPFLAAAERYDTITSLDMWVLERAVEVAAGRRPVAINVSARTVGRPFFLESVEYLLERDTLEPSLLTFEITESAVISDIVQAARFAERLRDIGCNFALDDFGTGYAAFTYLKNLPIQYLKIDRDFVRDLVDNKRSRAVVAGIVSMAAGFGQQTIAEGVENEVTLGMLRRVGVDMVQGFHVGRPAPID
jgi:EAL domain-containing protein (putative c-di-GMP-specific phosphodiesterase class I)